MNYLNGYHNFNGLIARSMALLTAIFVAIYAFSLPVHAVGKQVWAISMDNDLFVPFASSDRDFTGGMAFTYSGAKNSAHLGKSGGLLDRLDRQVIGQDVSERAAIPSIEFGFYGFTPNEIEDERVVHSDRPYASLVYLSMSRQYPMLNDRKRISTSLNVGVLGTDIMGDMQNSVHRALGNDEARGWHNQISDGGELTARYQIAWHEDWNSNTFSSRFKSSYFASIGYLTEAGVALSTRQGLISSPDNRFNPELISYGERVNETAATPNQGEERYFWGGISLKARLYNAFLQGQFRDSIHALDFNDLRPLIVEGWLGYTITLGTEYKASYVLRAQSSEIKRGEGDRSHVWGGIVVSRGV